MSAFENEGVQFGRRPQLSQWRLNLMTFSIMTFSVMIVRIMTFSVMIVRIMTFNITALSIMTFSITAVSIMTFSIIGLIVTLSIKDNQHIVTRHKHKVSLCWTSLCWVSLCCMLCLVSCCLCCLYWSWFKPTMADLKIPKMLQVLFLDQSFRIEPLS